MFQSHYGAIATGQNWVPQGCWEVSIPLWCDCDVGGDSNEYRCFVWFQSHYGAIATKEILSC